MVRLQIYSQDRGKFFLKRESMRTTSGVKIISDNPIIGAFGLNMDYEIEGNSMTVTIAGKELKLVKKG